MPKRKKRRSKPAQTSKNAEGPNVVIGGNVTNSNIVVGDNNSLGIQSGRPLLSAERIGIVPPTVVTTLFTIPSPISDFTGREHELEKLKSTLLHGMLIAGISGGGGIGKTELAHKLVDEIKNRFPDARMKIDLQGTSDSPLASDEAMRRLLEPFYMGQKLPDDSIQLKGLYQQTFASKKALLLLDNAANVSQVRSLIPPGPSAAIITSRQHFSLTEFGLKDLLRLATLSKEDARGFLRAACYKCIEAEDQVIDELAGLCSRLPLALRVAASMLNDRPDWALDTLIRRLIDERTRLQRLKRPGDTDLDVEAVISLSYSLLSPEMQRLFRMLGVFPLSFWHISAQDLWKIENPQEVDEHLGLLIHHSLVTTGFSPVGLGENPGVAYDMHDLTRLLAMGRLLLNVEEAKTMLQRFADQSIIVGNLALNEFLKGGENIPLGINLFRAIIPQLLVAWKRMQPGEKIWPRPDTADQWLSRFPAYFTDLLSICLPSAQLILILESSLDASKRINDKELEWKHLGNLGNAYLSRGYVLKGIHCFEELLEIYRELGNRADEGKTLGNIGSAYIVLDAHTKAIDYYQQAIDIAIEVGDRRNEGGWHANLGRIYDILGDYEKALTHTDKAISIFREIGERIGEAKAINSLGIVHTDLGDVKTGLKYHIDALRIDRELGNRRGEAATLVNMARIYFELGQLAKAKTFTEQAVVIEREYDSQADLGKSLTLLGLISFREGNHENAIAHSAEATSLLEAIGHPDAEYARAYLISFQAAAKFEEFARTAIRARHTKDPVLKEYFVLASKMARDPAMTEFQELGKVLQKILIGEENPNLSKLPLELAKLVQDELKK